MFRGTLILFALVALFSLGTSPPQSPNPLPNLWDYLRGMWSSPPTPQDTLYIEFANRVEDFHFTDQLGRPVSLDDLKGKVWVASLFFSTCLECSRYQNNMAALQEQLAGWPDVMLVSFSIDPEKDTPERMAHFGKSFGANPNRWLFVTGPKDEMYELVGKGSFYQIVGENPEPTPGKEYYHSFNFLVVDQRGKIRGYVDGTKPAEVERLGERVKKLVQARYLPTINASLNGLAGVLLVLGFIAVRKRRITTHKVFMWSALAVSALFLCCYLYYHFVVLEGQHSSFGGEGWIRPVYFTILISHTILAALVAPAALYITYLGVRDKLARHRTLARWTLPVWLYVSVTGVAVYLLLYHLYSPA